MTQEEKAKAYDEALDRMKHVVIVPKDEKALEILKETIFPELQESNDERTKKSLIKFLTDIKEISESGRTSWAVRKEDAEMCKSFLDYLGKQKEASKAIEAVERIDKYIDEHLANAHDMKDSNPEKKYYRGWDDALSKMSGILQDVYSGEKQKEWKEESLGDFVDNFPYSVEQKEQKPILEVFGFKVGDAVRLKDGDGRKHIIKSFEEIEWFHGPNFYHVEFEDNSASDGIYPGEEYPNGYYTQMEKLEEVQGPPQEEKQVSLTHEPPFDENPSDKEIIEALIKHLNEQDGFLTAINCVSTKAILSWLKKQKEQKPAGATINGEPIPTENKSVDIPLAEWSEEDDSMLNTIIADVKFVQQKCGLGTDEWNVHSEAIRWIKSLSERFNLQPKQEWSEDDERMQKEVEKMIVLFT